MERSSEGTFRPLKTIWVSAMTAADTSLPLEVPGPAMSLDDAGTRLIGRSRERGALAGLLAGLLAGAGARGEIGRAHV